MRTEKDFKAIQERYEQLLDEAFGPVDGEAPQPPQQPQPGPVPVQPGPLPSYPGYQDVYQSLICDKDACGALTEHWEDTFQPYNLGPPPADVAGQLRWYILRDLNEYHHKRHRLDFEDAKKHRVRERIGLLRRKLERADPLYRLTTDIMEHFEREHLPKSLQGSLQRLFTRCPHEFLDFYKEMRAVADEMVTRTHQGGSAS